MQGFTTHTVGLTAMRTLAGLGVATVAAACDRDPAWLARVEAGEQRISLKALGNLSWAYAALIAKHAAMSSAAQNTTT